MPKTYGGGSGPPKQIDLPDSTLTDIGRLVRAFAEIEDLVFLYICLLAEISASRAVALLGRTALKRRIEMAGYLAKMTGQKITELHKTIFGQEFEEIRKCRNAVCHGKYLGVHDDGGYAFLTQQTADPIGENAIQIVQSYHPLVISQFAKWAEEAVPEIEKRLKLEALRQERLRKPLGPHPKYQPRSNRKKWQKSPPRPSQK